MQKTIPILVVTIAAAILFAPTAGAMSAQQLRCEYLVDPIGIDTVRPRLSWLLASTRRGETQTAYEIRVASSDTALKAGKADLWDSGRVASNQQAQIPYGGKPMTSRLHAFWQVRVWDRDQKPSAFSAPATWEMGLLNPGDWHGKWIGAAPSPLQPIRLNDASWIWYPEGDATQEVPAATRYFKTQFTLPTGQNVRSARLRVAADNHAAIFVNGKPVGTSVDSWRRMDIFDIKGDLANGLNTIAISVQNDVAGPAGLIGRLEVDFDQGTPLTLVTNGSWVSAQQVSNHWQAAGMQDAGWTAAREVARWGGGPWGAPPVSSSDLSARPAPMLRRRFEIGDRIKHARAWICGLGYYELRLNGRKVGNHLLDPGYTAYDHRDLYVTYDITPYLKPGANAVGVILGTGWYDAHTLAVWNFDTAPWRALPKLLLEIEIETENGKIQRITSDESWKVSTGPILFDSIYGGENYDARLEKPGWDTAACDAIDWKPVAVVAAPKGKLTAQQMPAIAIDKSIRPVKVTEPKPGIFLFDMGQNFTGLPELTVQGSAGQTVVMRCAERLHPDGTLDNEGIAGFVKQRDPGQQYQTDCYTLKGKGKEVWKPRFTYHGFQYVEVTGYPGKPTLDSLRGVFFHTALEPAGTFSCSNSLFNQIRRNALWSYLSNMESIPTDCPHREKNGWTGDAQLACEQGIFSFQGAALYTKWLNDLSDAQHPAGDLPGIVPTSGWGYGIGPAWDSAYVLIPWYLYAYYGDTRVLAEHYAGMHRLVDYLTTQADKGIVSYGLGDWAPFDTTTPEAVTSTGYYYRDALVVADTAALLGKTEDARKYGALAAGIKAAFNARFYHADTGEYANGSQTALSCALYQGLVDDANRPQVLANLIAAIAKRGDHLDCGILGTKYVMNTLLENGRTDVAYRIADQRTLPSWGYWLAQGATTLWESWRGTDSLNHIMFGDVNAWFTKALAGINPDPAAPGFKHFFIRPNLVGNLTAAHADYDSIHGKIVSDWKLDHGVLTFAVTVPPNTTATVRVPTADAARLTEGGKSIQQAKGVTFTQAEPNAVTLELGSGTYRFTSPYGFQRTARHE